MRHEAGAGLLALASLLSAACSRAEKPVPPPGLLDSEGRPIVSAPPPQPAPAAQAPVQPTVYDFERPAPSSSAPSAAQNLGMSPPATTGGGVQAAGAGSRDLSAELSAKLNQMTDCVDAAQAATQPNGRLVVAVSAYVLGTGSISRATIDAPGQPATALDCLQRGVLAIKLPEPVVGAPINVKGSAEVEIKAVGPRPTGAAPTAAPAAPRGDVARGQPGAEVARPDQADLAGPP
jgi:hypothetical protein